jgi:hypothetical protein
MSNYIQKIDRRDIVKEIRKELDKIFLKYQQAKDFFPQKIDYRIEQYQDLEKLMLKFDPEYIKFPFK